MLCFCLSLRLLRIKKQWLNLMNNLISDIYQLLCNFLAHENFQQSQQFSNLCLMYELYQKGLYKNVEQEARKFEQKQVKSTIRDADFYYDK